MSKRCDKGSKAFAKVTIIRIEGKRGGKKREESRQNFNFDALKAGSKFPEESPDAGLPRLSRAERERERKRERGRASRRTKRNNRKATSGRQGAGF